VAHPYRLTPTPSGKKDSINPLSVSILFRMFGDAETADMTPFFDLNSGLPVA
jgi:hypothetical protein